MRIRSIKPEFWRSADIASLSFEDRLLFIGLWSYVDDNGVGDARVSSIAADLFADDLAGDPPETLRRVSGGCKTLSERGLIDLYEAGGKKLIHIRNWSRHQVINKPSKGHQYPLPPGVLPDPKDSLRSVTGHTPDTLRTHSGTEQGNRGTGEQGNGGAGEQLLLRNSCLSSPRTRENDDRLVDNSENEIDGINIYAIQRTLSEHCGIDVDVFTATRIVGDVMAKATDRVLKPTAYVQAAIRAEPNVYIEMVNDIRGAA